MNTDPDTRESTSATAVEGLLEFVRLLADDRVRTDLQYRALRIQQASLKQRYWDRIGELTRDEYEEVMHEIQRLAERLVKPVEELEEWEIVYQAAYNPTSPLRAYFWPELRTAAEEPRAPVDDGSRPAGACEFAEAAARDHEQLVAAVEEPTRQAARDTEVTPAAGRQKRPGRPPNSGADLAARVTWAAESVEKARPPRPRTWTELRKTVVRSDGKRGIDATTLHRWMRYDEVRKALGRSGWPAINEPDAQEPGI